MSFPTFPRLAALGASLLLVLVSPATLMAADTEPFNLQPLFTVDRSARYSVWTRRESVVEMDFGGRSRQFKRDTTVEGEITWTVKKVNADGSAQCVMVIDWLSATVINPDGRTVVADSRKSSSDSPPLHEAVRALSNTPITFDLVDAIADLDFGAHAADALQVEIHRAGADLVAARGSRDKSPAAAVQQRAHHHDRQTVTAAQFGADRMVGDLRRVDNEAVRAGAFKLGADGFAHLLRDQAVANVGYVAKMAGLFAQH